MAIFQGGAISIENFFSLWYRANRFSGLIGWVFPIYNNVLNDSKKRRLKDED
jgi:hypothetical protein